MKRANLFVKPHWVLLVLLCASPVLGDAQRNTRQAMADAMSRMMEAMGLFDSGSGGSGGTDSSWDWDGAYLDGLAPYSSWTPGLGGFSMPGAMPWGSPLQYPTQVFGPGAMTPWPSPGIPATPFGYGSGRPYTRYTRAGSRLEGIWEGRDGELLIVQGERFRIYSGDSRHVDGRLRISADRLAMSIPKERTARRFQYKETRDRLIMRGEDGELYLYRRLVLDGGERAAGSRRSPIR